MNEQPCGCFDGVGEDPDELGYFPVRFLCEEHWAEAQRDHALLN